MFFDGERKKNISQTIGDLTRKIRSFLAHDFFHNPIVQWMFIGAFFFNMINWAMLFFFIKPINFPIILHYNVYFGVDIIGNWWQVYFLPAMGAAFFAINMILAYVFFQSRERIASYLLLLTSFILQVGNIIASSGVIFINY